MEPDHEPKATQEPQPAEPSSVPKKRFHVVKLEERIAPRRGKPPQSGNSGTDLVSGSWVY